MVYEEVQVKDVKDEGYSLGSIETLLSPFDHCLQEKNMARVSWGKRGIPFSH
jgi:hypothetical protein